MKLKKKLKYQKKAKIRWKNKNSLEKSEKEGKNKYFNIKYSKYTRSIKRFKKKEKRFIKWSNNERIKLK
jgi:hypothetical protein